MPISRLDELPDRIQKHVQPVMVHPMAGALDRQHRGVLERDQPAVGGGVGGPAFGAVDQQGRALDAGP